MSIDLIDPDVKPSDKIELEFHLAWAWVCPYSKKLNFYIPKPDENNLVACPCGCDGLYEKKKFDRIGFQAAKGIVERKAAL